MVREDWDPTQRRWLTQRLATCDLDAFLAGDDQARCGFITCDRNFACGCWMCTGQPGRRLKRRQERGRWRSVRQRMLAERAWEDADPWVAPREVW